jgi:hypothetical protein
MLTYGQIRGVPTPGQISASSLTRSAILYSQNGPPGGASSKTPCSGEAKRTKSMCEEPDGTWENWYCTTGKDCQPQCICGKPKDAGTSLSA